MQAGAPPNQHGHRHPAPGPWRAGSLSEGDRANTGRLERVRWPVAPGLSPKPCHWKGFAASPLATSHTQVNGAHGGLAHGREFDPWQRGAHLALAHVASTASSAHQCSKSSTRLCSTSHQSVKCWFLMRSQRPASRGTTFEPPSQRGFMCAVIAADRTPCGERRGALLPTRCASAKARIFPGVE